jgi:hypothetical protein
MPLTWRTRLERLGVAAILCALLTGPYLVNCWRTFGDPLYAINVHADVYRAAEGQQIEAKQTATEYIRATLSTRPWTTVDTALQGMTTYPFTNKWTGFDAWSPWLGRILSWLAILGLALHLRTREGQLLLVVLAGSLVPYALTWKLIFDWRFTMHAYPFFLIASFCAIHRVGVVLRPAHLREWIRQPSDRSLAPAMKVGALSGAAVAFTFLLLHPSVAAETLRAGDPMSFGPYYRDKIYFRNGWSSAKREGNVVTRISTGRAGRIDVPLPEICDYIMTIRMDPFPSPRPDTMTPLPAVRVLLNDQLVAVVQLQWDPQRLGSYRVTVPASAVRAKGNGLTLMPSDGQGRETRIRFWYVRVWRAPTT